MDKARDVAGNDFMYWELTRRASERGLRVRLRPSKKGTGHSIFPRELGLRAAGPALRVRLVKRRACPRVEPAQSKYQLAIKAGSHALALANLMARIARNLG